MNFGACFLFISFSLGGMYGVKSLISKLWFLIISSIVKPPSLIFFDLDLKKIYFAF